MTEKEFTSLVPELRQTALHVCRGCGTDGMTAEDVAQDTMLRLWGPSERTSPLRNMLKV